uniref:Pericentrin/AKAP9-like protein n=1 Tax=Halisarca dujardinii TaxID=2583056 RepID=A0A9F1UCM5_HALDU|nr:pericentrin/AKAP9-like protein [Halisarca dujardinii]
MDSKKKKKKSAKTKSAETKSGSSPDDEYTNSQSSNLMSLGDSYPNFSEEDISEMSVPKVASGSGVSPEKSDNSILEPSSPGGEHTDGWTGSSVHKLESEPAVGQTDNLLVDSGLGATKSFTPRLDQVIQPGALEGEWHDYGRPFSGADNDFSSTMLDPSLIPGLDSGLETAQTPQHSQVQFPLTSNSQNGDGSGPFGIGEEGTRPIDDHKPLLPTCEDSWSPLQSQAQEEDLRQQISSLKTAHKNELETVHSSFALKMENYHKQVEEAANAQIQAQYASLETAVRLQQKQNEDSQAALLSTLDKEQSLRTDLEDEIQSLRQNSSYLQAKPNEQEQLQSAYDDLERKFHQTAADCDTKIVDLTSKWQKEKDQLLKELDHYVTEARSLSFTDFEAQLQKLTLQLEDSQNRESEIDQSFNDLKAQSSALERDKEDAAAHLEQVMQGHEKEMSELKSALQQERDYLAGNQILLNEQHKEKNTAAVEQEAALRQMFQQEKAEIAERFRQQEDVLRQQEAMWQERFYAEKDRTHTLEEHLDELVTCKEALREYEDVNRNLLSQMESLNQNLGQSENANEMLAEDNRIFQAAKEKIEKELDILTSKCRQQDAKMTELSKSIETNQSAPVYGASTQVGAPEDVRSGPESEILKQISSISLKADATLLKALESAGIKSHGSVSDVVGDLCSSVSASSSEIVSLEEKGDALQGVVDSLLEKQKDLSIQLESATKEVETLKGDSLGRDRLVQVEEQLKKDLSAKDALVEKLIAENENLEVQLATRDVGEDSGKARVGRIVSGMSDLESQVREDHDRLTRKLKERESLEAELAKQTTVLKRKEDEKKMLEALIGEKAKLEQELLDQKQHLQNSLDAIQEKMRIQKLTFEQQSTEKERDHSRNMAALRDEQNQLNTDHKLELERLNRLLEVSVDENKSLNEIFDEEATNRQRLEEKVSALKEQNAGQKQHLFDQLAQLRRELDGAHQQKVQELLEESASRRTTVEADYDAKLSDLSREHLRKVEKTHESHATEVAELKSAIEKHEGTIQNLKLALDADSTGKEQLLQQLEALQNREEELKREFAQEMNKFKAGVDSAHQQKLQDLHQQSQAAVEAELEAAQKAHSQRVAELVEEQSRKIGELQTESASKVAELKSAIEKHEGTIQNLKLALDADSTGKEQLHQQLEALQNREEELKREFVQEMNKFKAGVDSAHQQKLQDLHQQSQAAVEAELEAAQKAHSQRVAELVEEQSRKIGELQTENASKMEMLEGIIASQEQAIQSLHLSLEEERGRAKAEADQLRDAHLEEKKSLDQALQSKCESLADMTEKHEMLMANLSQVQADTVRSLMEKVSSLDDQLKETSKQAGELEERLGQEQAEAQEREANLLDVQAALNSHNASALTVVKLCNDLLQLRQSTPSSASSESREIPEVNSLVGKVQKVKDLVLSKNGEIESLQAERVRLEEQVVALTATAPVTTCNVGVQSKIPPREKGEVVLSNLLVDAAIVSAKESLKSEAEVEKVRQANSIALDELLRKHDQQLSDLQNALLLEHKQQNELLSQKFREDLQRALARQEESLNEAHRLEIDGIKQSAGLEVAALTHANREQQQALQNLQHLAGEQEAAVGALKSELAQDRLNHQQEVSRLKGLFASSARGLQEEVDGRNRSELESNLQALQLVHRQEKNKLIQLHQRDLARFEADLAEAHTKWRDLDALLTDKQRLLDTVRAEATADVESLKNEINILQGQLKAERERSVFDTEEKNKMLHHMRGSHGVSGSHPLLERNEFSLVDTILLQKIEALTPVLKEEARELSQLTDLLNSANLPESKSAATYTEGTSPSVIHLTQQQDGRTPVEELSSMVARLAAEKADLQAQLAELQDQLRVARMDLERAGLEKAGTERAHSSDARRLQWQLTSSAQGLEDAKDRLRQEQAQLLECQLMLSRKDQDLVKQAAKVKALSDELHLSKARAQSLSASLQRNQQELNNAQRIIREYLSLVGRPAGPEAGAGHREHPAQLESPLSAGCVELLQHVQATQDQLDTAKGKLAAKQMDMKRLQKLYHKSESHRRNLAFQKFYLTQKVDSFFHTQQAAFDILQDMGLVDIVRLHQQSPCTHPRQRFRARVWVVIAHLRLLHFWRRAKQVS